MSRIRIVIEADISPCGEDEDHDTIIDIRNYEREICEQIAGVLRNTYCDAAFTGDLPFALDNGTVEIRLDGDADGSLVFKGKLTWL